MSIPSGGLGDHAHHADDQSDFVVTGPDVEPMQFLDSPLGDSVDGPMSLPSNAKPTQQMDDTDSA